MSFWRTGPICVVYFLKNVVLLVTDFRIQSAASHDCLPLCNISGLINAKMDLCRFMSRRHLRTEDLQCLHPKFVIPPYVHDPIISTNLQNFILLAATFLPSLSSRSQIHEQFAQAGKGRWVSWPTLSMTNSIQRSTMRGGRETSENLNFSLCRKRPYRRSTIILLLVLEIIVGGKSRGAIQIRELSRGNHHSTAKRASGTGR